MGLNRAFAFGIALVLVSVSPVSAEDPKTGTLSILFENDLFYGWDRDYTNGVQISWLSEPDHTPAWAVRAARALPFFPDEGRIRASYALGQTIYTPRDITVRNPPLSERPYAGWFYVSMGLVAETGRRLDQLQLQVGVVGPASLSEQSQKFVHRVIDDDIPRGWHTQLKNEPAFLLTYQRSWRALVLNTSSGFTFDVTPHLGGALGTVFTYANAGATLRFGWNPPNDYGPPRIQPSLPGSAFFEPKSRFGWYLFAGIEGRAVARNLFLDGNTWQDSRSVDKRPFVGDLQVGAAVTWGSARLAYTHVFRSKEYAGQSGVNEFGAVSLSIRF